VLKAGFVLVGNVPSADGTSAMVKAGSLLVLNRTGDIVAQWTPAMAKIDGPWDLTIFDQGNQAKVFVSNVLNGTVVRLDVAVSEDGVQIKGATQIASGYAFRGDPAALASSVRADWHTIRNETCSMSLLPSTMPSSPCSAPGTPNTIVARVS
jgi:hypothetical protein